jgi:Tfp pilus assembly protein PilO
MRSLQNQSEWCTRVQWILGGGLTVVILAFYLLWCRPENNRLISLRQQIAAQQQQVRTGQAKAALLPQKMEQVEKLRVKVEQFDKRMPRTLDLGQFMRDITQLSQHAALKKLAVQPGVPRRAELYCEMPIQLTFEGDFSSIFEFLQKTEQMQRMTRIRGLSIHGREISKGLVEVQVSMNIYFAEGG